MLMVYRKIIDLLDPRERQRFALLLAMILIMGLVDLAGVASILPFLAVLANPDLVQTNSYLARLNQLFGFTDPQSFLIFLGSCTFALVVFGQAFKALTVYALMRFSLLREYTISARLLGGYLHQPYAWFLNRHSSDLGMSVLSEVEKVVNGVLIPALRVLAQGAVAVLLIGLLLAVQPTAAIAMALIVGGSYGLVLALTRRYLNRIGRERLQANTERFRITQDAMRGIKDVKLLGLENSYLSRFRRPAERFARLQASATSIAEMPRYLLEAIVFGAMLLFILTLMVTTEGKLETLLPILGVYAFAGARLIPAAQMLYRGISGVRFQYPSLEALHDTLRETGSTPPQPGNGRPVTLRGSLELRDVRYTYPGASQPALRDLDLAIPANSTVGLVGSTGSGKTTAVDLLLGLLEPQEGSLVVDGTVIDATNRRAWQRNLGYVPQDIFLLDDTIAANIALGVPSDEIDMEAVERAARLAELHDFVVSELSEGYASKVGERGVRLSGGQRQRIGIARALYRDPDVLILDEATSALDTLTERAVMDAVHNLGHRKTIIMIAHRLSTVRVCDRIFLLDHGSCSASGTFEELEQGNSVFKKMAAWGP